MRPPLKQFVQPRIDAARTAREWDAIRVRRAGTKQPWYRLSLSQAWPLGAAVAIAVVALVVLRRPAPRAVADGAWLESGASEGTHVALAEGTQVALDPNSRVHFLSVRPENTQIELERGGIRIDARPTPRRALAVRVGGYEARVHGEHVVVHRLGFAIDVRAQGGDVDIAAPDGGLHTVHAGETWTAKATEASPEAQAVESTPAPALSAAPPIDAAPAPSARPANGAKALFDEAQRARADGRLRDAARLLDKLRQTYRHDPRAGFSAFELGRLRLDTLGDPRGAEEAFRDAIALAPGSPFREDAEARRVQALSRLGDHATCVAAAEAYLTRYPAGPYRNAVLVYCGGP